MGKGLWTGCTQPTDVVRVVGIGKVMAIDKL